MQAALGSYRETLQLFPDVYLIHHSVGLIHAKSENYAEAVNEFGLALNKDTKNPMVLDHMTRSVPD